MTTYRQGQIVIVPFPFTDDFTQQKQRPALIISANWYNKDRKICVLVAITSNTYARESEDLLIKGKEMQQTGLLHESVIKVSNIFAINQDRIRKTLGIMPRGLLVQVLNNLQTVFTDSV